MIIDSHHHFWTFDPARQPWIAEEDEIIRRDFLPHHLLPSLVENEVDGTVVVQAEPSLAETDWLLKLADDHDFIRGVIGWVDLTAEEVNRQLDRYADHPKLRGIRMLVQDETDPLFLLRPEFLSGIEQLFARGYTYDLLIYPHQLTQAIELVANFPEGRFVIDHLAKPYIEAGWRTGWEVSLRALGAYENCYCKLSGMVTEADRERWTRADLLPYLEVLFAAFPADRIMWGSDWPVCLLATDYREWKDTVTDFLQDRSPDERESVMGKTATVFYGL